MRVLYSCVLVLVWGICLVNGQDATATAGTAGGGVCQDNQFNNGQKCVCSAGYFASANELSRSQCEDECEEVYYTWFTYGDCVGNLFDRMPDSKQPSCNMRCGMRFRVWAVVFILAVFLAALATLFFTVPMCIATCCSCLQAKKAHENTKRVYVDQSHATAAHGAHDKQLQSMGYNPYAYWPYYGRT